MANLFPLAFEMVDVSDEIKALREAVEVLENRDDDSAWYLGKNWESQRNECARLSAQVNKLHERINNPDWGYEACNTRQAQTIRDARERATKAEAELSAVLRERSKWAMERVRAEHERDKLREYLCTGNF